MMRAEFWLVNISEDREDDGKIILRYILRIVCENGRWIELHAMDSLWWRAGIGPTYSQPRR